MSYLEAVETSRDYGRLRRWASARPAPGLVVMTARSQPISTALTEREIAVLTLVVEGLTNRAIALELHLSTSTVQAHVAAGMRKLQARSRTQLAVIALRAGIVPLYPEDSR